jgi:hypothetical protein
MGNASGYNQSSNANATKHGRLGVRGFPSETLSVTHGARRTIRKP